MSVIAVWSPLRSGSGATMFATNLAIMMAYEYQVKVLLTHGGGAGERVEQGLAYARETMDRVIAFQDNGMDALERLNTSGRLNPEALRNYTSPLLSDRLDLLRGASRFVQTQQDAIKKLKDQAPTGETLMSRVMQASKISHDITIADAGNGWPGESDRSILGSAELVVIGLNQNMHVLERAIGSQLPEEIKNKHCIYVIGKYDPESHCTLQNIKRRYGLKTGVYGIPYCSGMTDAWNRRAVLSYLQRLRGSGDGRRTHPFYATLRQTGDGVAQQLGFLRGVPSTGGTHVLG